MIYPFHQLTAENQPPAGGKGGTLAKLAQAGYPIPDGFVILPTAFTGSQLRPDVWQQVQHHLNRLRSENGRSSFAVRSSALAEDAANTSFAGEFETVLDVKTDEAIQTAIQQVRESGQHTRVQAYSQAHGLTEVHQVAVVVQKLVQAELSGVLFTADPVTGSHTIMPGNFIHGLGDRLVSGEANPEIFQLKRPNGIYEGPTVLKKYGRSLYQLATRLEQDLGGPQDIEWAVANGQVYILQARPITTLQGNNPTTGEQNDSLRGDYLWTNANFGEAVPDVMTLFTWSLLQIYGEETFSLPALGHHPFMGNIGGRFYLNMSLFASLLMTMGFSRERLMYESEEFFGNIPPDLPIPLIPYSRWQVLRQFIPFAFRAKQRSRRNQRNLASFTAEIPARTIALHSQIAAIHEPSALIELWQQALEPLIRQTCQMLQAGTSLYENAIRPLRHQLRQQVGEADMNALLSGLGELASLGPVVGLWKVATGEWSRETYLHHYGHRGAHEFELSMPRPAEDPAWLDEQLTGLAQTDVPGLLAKQQMAHAQAWQRYAQKFPRQATKTRPKLDAAAAAGRGREAIRSEVVRLFGAARAFALRAGQLSGLGESIFFLSYNELLKALTESSSSLLALRSSIASRQQAHARYAALPPYPGLINGRFDPFAWAQNPNHRSDIFDSHSSLLLAPHSSAIKGFAGAAGIVEGTVRRLDTIEEGHLLQPGEVLVTTTTNIGWTPLFPRAAAIVTDVGAPLSHAAIVARELGIPAVVGCGNATMRLKTGDRVRLNGGAGVVELYDQVTNE